MPDIAKKTKAKIKMIEIGIVPALTGSDLKDMLSSMTNEEKRTAKRKFRKLWRKIAKSNTNYSYLLNSESKGVTPDEHTLKMRAKIVVGSIIRSIK